jgi:hypothetical protein
VQKEKKDVVSALELVSISRTFMRWRIFPFLVSKSLLLITGLCADNHRSPWQIHGIRPQLFPEPYTISQG